MKLTLKLCYPGIDDIVFPLDVHDFQTQENGEIEILDLDAFNTIRNVCVGLGLVYRLFPITTITIVDGEGTGWEYPSLCVGFEIPLDVLMFDPLGEFLSDDCLIFDILTDRA